MMRTRQVVVRAPVQLELGDLEPVVEDGTANRWPEGFALAEAEQLAAKFDAAVDGFAPPAMTGVRKDKHMASWAKRIYGHVLARTLDVGNVPCRVRSSQELYSLTLPSQ